MLTQSDKENNKNGVTSKPVISMLNLEFDQECVRV